jgi:hypothetical protein
VNNITPRRLAKGIVGVCLLSAIVLMLAVVVDRSRHIPGVVASLLILWAAYMWALRRKSAK